uniref:Uncharacterized protein n=1 Tax=Myoviridae sp. ctaOv25 TaxID=2827290 RepID=A0A8S5R6B2_9CAUD|nr:MAG TPA: hypothetical protein [Myoviridae sp. ctaOv25]
MLHRYYFLKIKGATASVNQDARRSSCPQRKFQK